MKIRKLEEKDIEQASKIVLQNYWKAYEKLSLRELEAMYYNHAVKPCYFVADHNGMIVGLWWYSQSRMDYNIYEIFWINVIPSYQRKWIWSQLVKKIITTIQSKKGKIILLTTNKPQFYSDRFNFKKLSTIDQKEKEYIMILDLKKK